jgi:hypothetical protein
MVDASDVRPLKGRVGRFYYFIGVAQGGVLPCIWMDVLFSSKTPQCVRPDGIARPLKKWFCGVYLGEGAEHMTLSEEI